MSASRDLRSDADAATPKSAAAGQAHTPGPWEVRRTASDRDLLPGTTHHVSVITRANNLDGLEHLKMLNGDYHVCKFNPTKRPEAADMMERDARLIASAPELLEALKNVLALAVLKYGNLNGEATAVFDQARLAISKASPSLDGGRDD